MIILLAFLFWPFSHHHVERFTVTLDTRGEAIHEFKRDFPDNDSWGCKFDAKHPDSIRIVAKQRGGIHLLGHPGEIVKAVCQ